MMTVTALTPQKRRPGRTSVFVDGSFVFGMDNADLAKHKLSEGMEITRERLNFLLKQVVCVNARDSALRYLGSRPRSRQEVERRLEADGYPKPVVTYVIKLMVKYRYINDAEYAGMYAESRLKQGYGRFRVKRELKQKGIADAYIEAALAKAGDGELSHIREWLLRKRYDPAADYDPVRRKRITDALLRRGFTYGAIKEALENE